MTRVLTSPSAKLRGGFFRKVALTALCAAAVLTGCGKEESGSMSYEKPVHSMKAAANYGDEESYLSCWLPQEKRHFRLAEDEERGFLDSVFSRDDHESRLRVKVRDSSELSESEIDDLEKDASARYGTRLVFSKAFKLNVDFRVQDNLDLLSDSREITVVRYGDVWYIYGDVIDSFTFARS